MLFVFSIQFLCFIAADIISRQDANNFLQSNARAKVRVRRYDYGGYDTYDQYTEGVYEVGSDEVDWEEETRFEEDVWESWLDYDGILTNYGRDGWKEWYALYRPGYTAPYMGCCF